jgi:hypothetical protein
MMSKICQRYYDNCAFVPLWYYKTKANCIITNAPVECREPAEVSPTGEALSLRLTAFDLCKKVQWTRLQLPVNKTCNGFYKLLPCINGIPTPPNKKPFFYKKDFL